MSESEPPHLLTPEKLADIFANDVRPTLTASSQENPRVLILGGPQGSGKTTLRRVVAEQLGLQDAVLYDGDDMFDFHPLYADLAREHGGLEAMTRCDPDVGELRRMTLEHVRQNKQDLVLVGPYTHEEYTLGLVQEFRDAGYLPEMAYTARHPAMSQLGVVHRHHQATGPDGIGYSILPSLELQAKIFEGVPKIMAEAERRGAVEALHVVDRTGVVFTKRHGADGQWAPETDVQEVVRTTRYRLWSPGEREDFLRRRAEAGTGNGDQWPKRLESIDRLAAPALEASGATTTPRKSAETPRRPSIAEASRSRSTTGRPPTTKGPSGQSGASAGHHSGPEKRRGRGR